MSARLVPVCALVLAAACLGGCPSRVAAPAPSPVESAAEMPALAEAAPVAGPSAGPAPVSAVSQPAAPSSRRSRPVRRPEPGTPPPQTRTQKTGQLAEPQPAEPPPPTPATPPEEPAQASERLQTETRRRRGWSRNMPVTRGVHRPVLPAPIPGSQARCPGGDRNNLQARPRHHLPKVRHYR